MSTSVLQAQLDQALAHHKAGRFEAALGLYARVRQLQPRHFEAHYLAGLAQLQASHFQEAVGFLRQATTLQPKAALPWMCLGVACQSLGRAEEAERHLRHSLTLDSRNAECWANLGSVLANTGKAADALKAYETSLKLQPSSADALNGLGTALLLEGKALEALSFQQQALKANPAHPRAGACAAQALQQLNRTREAIDAFDEHLTRVPSDLEARSQRLLLLNYLEELTPSAVFESHRAFGEAAEAKTPTPLKVRVRAPEAPLKVGFLSPDLRHHSVAHFLEPLLAHLNPKKIAVLLYHDHFTVDATSQRLKTHAAVWRNFVGQNAAVVEEQLRRDAPDILIDLAGHTGFNRLPLFAKRLAPVQISYLGYPNTTGLTQMDFRLTDALADPLGSSETFATETLLRFPRCAWVYQPLAEAPPVVPPPALSSPRKTIGSFNALNKLSDGTLKLWARLLEENPDTDLLLKSPGMNTATVAKRLEAAGIARDRFLLLPSTAGARDHLSCYGRLDLALDPFPYNGTTTTCEALWMGVPVVTLAGDRHASRVGTSLLTQAGLPEFVAQTHEDYVAKVSAALRDLPSLARLRAGLREKLLSSPLMDYRSQADAFVHLLEQSVAAKMATPAHS